MQEQIDPKYRAKVYKALKGELGNSFSKTENEFYNALDNDSSYAGKVYAALKGELGKSFSKTQDQFNSLVLKKKEDTSEDIAPKQDLVSSGGPKTTSSATPETPKKEEEQSFAEGSWKNTDTEEDNKLKETLGDLGYSQYDSDDAIKDYKAWKSLGQLSPEEQQESAEKEQDQKQGDLGIVNNVSNWVKAVPSRGIFFNPFFNPAGISKPKDLQAISKDIVEQKRIDFLQKIDDPKRRKAVEKLVQVDKWRNNNNTFALENSLSESNKSLSQIQETAEPLLARKKELEQMEFEEGATEQSIAPLRQEHESIVSQLSELQNKGNELLNTHNEIAAKYQESREDIGTFEDELNLLKRDYQFLNNAGNIISTGFEEIGEGLKYQFNRAKAKENRQSLKNVLSRGLQNDPKYADMVDEKYQSKDYTYNEDDFDAETEVLKKEIQDSSLDAISKLNERRETFTPSVEAGDIDSVSDFFDFTANGILSTTPTLIQLGIPYVGQASFLASQQATSELGIRQGVKDRAEELKTINEQLNNVDKYSFSPGEVSQLNTRKQQLENQEDPSELAILGSSTAMAASEILLARVGKVRLLNKAKRTAQAIGKKALGEGVRKSAKKELFDFGKDVSGEGLEEFGVGVIGNIAEIYVIGDTHNSDGSSRSILDGSFGNTLGGLSTGGVLSGNTKILGFAANAISDKKRKTIVLDNVTKINALMELLDTEEMSPELRLATKNQITKLNKENGEVINATLKSYANLPPEKRKEIARLDGEMQAQQVALAELGKKKKPNEDLVSSIKQNLQDLDSQKEALVNEGVEITKSKDDNLAKNKSEAVADEASTTIELSPEDTSKSKPDQTKDEVQAEGDIAPDGDVRSESGNDVQKGKDSTTQPAVEPKTSEAEVEVAPKTKSILKAAKGQLGRLAGKSNIELRRDILEELTGVRPPKSKSGINAVKQALYEASNAPKGSDAAKQEHVNKWASNQSSAVETKEVAPKKAEVKTEPKTTTRKVTTEKGHVYDVTFNEKGEPISAVHPKTGKTVQKITHRKIKPTKKNNWQTKKAAKTSLWSDIEAKAKGTITEGQISKERKQRINRILEDLDGTDAYSLALIFLARGGTVSWESAKKQGADKAKKRGGHWVTRGENGFEKQSKAKSTERAAEDIGGEARSKGLNVEDYYIQVELDLLIKENESRNDIENILLDLHEVNKVKEQEQELAAYKNSLSAKELDMLESVEAEEGYLSELNYEENVQYYEEQYERPNTENDGNRESETPSVQERTGSKESKGGKSESESETTQAGFLGNSKKKRDPTLKGKGPVRQLDELQKKYRKFIGKWFKSNSQTSNKIGEAVRFREMLRTKIHYILNREVEMVASIEKSIAKNSKNKTEQNTQLLAVRDYMLGNKDADLSFLKPEQVEQLNYLRDKIDANSTKLVNRLMTVNDSRREKLEEFEENSLAYKSISEAIERTENLISTIEKNKGSYLHRTYQAFTDSDYLNDLTGGKPNKAGRDRINAAAQHLVDNSADLFENQISFEDAVTKVYEYLNDLKGNTDIINALIQGKAKAPFLKKKDDAIPDVFLDLLGEHREPSYMYASTQFKIQSFLADIEYQNRLGRELEAAGLVSYTDGPGLERLVGGKDKKDKQGKVKDIDQMEGWGVLDGMRVSAEVKQSIMDLQPLEYIQTGWVRKWVQGAGYVKVAKTVLSPTAAWRNLFSGNFLAAQAGFSVFTSPKHFLKAVQTSWGAKKTSKELREETIDLIERGIVSDGAKSKVLMKLLNDFTRDVDQLTRKGGFAKIMEVFQKFYAFGDDFYKVVGYKTYVDRYMKTGMSESQAKDKAAERIRDTFPTYSKLPLRIRQLRQIPLVGTFVSFTHEVLRTNVNSVKYLVEDAKAGRKTMVAQQAVGMAIAHATASALSKISMLALDIDDQEDDAIRDMQSPWKQDAELIYFGEEDGYPVFLDATSFFPNEYIHKLVRIALEERKGRSGNERIARLAKEALAPYLGVDISLDSALELASNKDANGSAIYRGENLIMGLIESPLEVTNYALKKVGPGFYNNISEFARANEVAPDYFGEKSNMYGREYTNKDAAFGLFGFRVNTFNYAGGIKSMAFKTSDQFKEIKSYVNRKIKVPRELSTDKIKSLVDDYQKDYEATSEKALHIVTQARKLGVSTDKIFLSLKSSGFSKKDIGVMLEGMDAILKPFTKQSLSTRAVDIYNVYSEDATMSKKQRSILETNARNFNNEVIERINKKIDNGDYPGARRIKKLR